MEFAYRVEQHILRPRDKYYNMIDKYAFASKNMYNKALYEQRQCYCENHKFMRFSDLWTIVKDTKEAKNLPIPGMCQTICKQVTNDCYTFQKTERAYKEHPERFKSKVKLPKYKNKFTGRNMIELTSNQIKIIDGTVQFHKSFNDFQIKMNNEIEYIEEIRITKRNSNYYIDLVYMIEIKADQSHLTGGAAIDLGVDNFATIIFVSENKKVNPKIINGKGLKSYNKRFNKKLNFYKSEAKKKNNKNITKRIERLYEARRNYMKNFMHKASRMTINWCLENNIKYLVVGYNKGWKNGSKLSKKNFFNFMMIPYEKYVRMLKYKAKEAGIKVILHEEAFTSGTSFLDDEPPTEEYYDKSRRIRRGLFISNQGIKINADVNGAYQILRKVFLKVTYDNKILSCGIQPIKYNAA